MIIWNPGSQEFESVDGSKTLEGNKRIQVGYGEVLKYFAVCGDEFSGSQLHAYRYGIPPMRDYNPLTFSSFQQHPRGVMSFPKHAC